MTWTRFLIGLKKQDKTLYILGGASIYKAFLPHCDAIIKTTVHGVFEGDTYFPDIDLTSFRKVSETFQRKKMIKMPTTLPLQS